LSRLSCLLKKARSWLIGGTIVLGASFAILETARQVLILTGCLTEILGSASGISGFDFEVSETDCWHSPAVSVFVSLPGGGKRTRIFQYVRDADSVPTIVSIDENTVRVSLSKANEIACQRQKWGSLTIKYDIGPVRYPSLNPQVPEC